MAANEEERKKGKKAPARLVWGSVVNTQARPALQAFRADRRVDKAGEAFLQRRIYSLEIRAKLLIVWH